MAARDDESAITLVMTLGSIEGGKALAAAACEAFADGCAAAAGTCTALKLENISLVVGIYRGS